MKDDPLQLSQFYADTRNLLDKCYWQTLSGAVIGPNSILMHLALEMGELGPSLWLYGVPKPTGTVLKTPQEIVNICNLSDSWVLKRFADENSHLIHIGYSSDKRFQVKDPRQLRQGKIILGYYVPRWLRGFFFDPNRSQSLYSISWIFSKSKKAIEEVIVLNSGYYSLFSFFDKSQNYGEISGASHLHIRNGSDRNLNELLHFLRYLSEIPWLDIYSRGSWGQRHNTNAILHWVHTTLVG
jgi:hypothetical protein